MKYWKTLFILAVTCTAVNAQQLDVDFEIFEDDQAAGCGGSIVSGLDPNGDGFLSVRTGPGSNFTKIDELHNNDWVRTCVVNGKWVGIYYGEPRQRGWVHGNWLVSKAG